MKHQFPVLNLNIARAEKRINGFISMKFPYYKSPKPTVESLRQLEVNKLTLQIDFFALEVLNCDQILRDYESIVFTLSYARELLEKYFKQLQIDGRQLARDCKFANNSPEVLEFQRYWLPYLPYKAIFRPGFDNAKLVRRQARFQQEIESQSLQPCTAELPAEMRYFVDLTRLVRLCYRLPLSDTEREQQFSAINVQNQKVDIGKFFE